jgi:Flp pilus assembly pilin Flp
MPTAIATVSTSVARASRISPETKDMKNLIARFVREEEGQDVIEYALLGAFISIVAIIMIGNVGTEVNEIYTEIHAALQSRP